MSAFIFDYGLFLAKLITSLAAIIFAIAALGAIRRGLRHSDGFEIEHLNQKFEDNFVQLNQALLDKPELKKVLHEIKRQHKAKKDKPQEKRVFLLDFKGDLQASAVASLREEVSAVLNVARDNDEVIVRLENPGGLVHDHGLAASQLARLRERHLHVTAAVDKVAASGGYLMACVANQIVAAPFAIIGSIGVLAQLPNFNRLLKEKGVEFEQLQAGEFKRTLTLFGENTDEGRAKMQQELDELHQLFQATIQKYRPTLDIARVATGEHWFGQHALKLGLVDALGTSDDLLWQLSRNAQIYSLTFQRKQSLADRALKRLQASLVA